MNHSPEDILVINSELGNDYVNNDLIVTKIKNTQDERKNNGVKRLMTVKICSPWTIYIINILKYVMILKRIRSPNIKVETYINRKKPKL